VQKFRKKCHILLEALYNQLFSEFESEKQCFASCKIISSAEQKVLQTQANNEVQNELFIHKNTRQNQLGRCANKAKNYVPRWRGEKKTKFTRTHLRRRF